MGKEKFEQNVSETSLNIVKFSKKTFSKLNTGIQMVKFVHQ